jgi:RNA recognition motif-containing protein
MNIFIGNLAGDVSDDDLKQAFAVHGQVAAASVIKDRDTGQSRGFGFVEMPNAEEAKAAIAALNGTDLKGKAVRVSEAHGPAGGRGGRGGGRGGGGAERPGGRGRGDE